MFHRLSTRRYHKSSNPNTATTTSPAPLTTPAKRLSYLPWDQSSYSVASSVFLAELNGDSEWNSQEEEREEESWNYLDAEHVAAAVDDIAHGEVFEYVEGTRGRELTQRCVCFEIPSGSGGGESDEAMDPVFYARWLERHRDLVDGEGRLRDGLEESARETKCEKKRKRTASPYPGKEMCAEKGLFRRLSKVLKRRKFV